MKKHFCVLTLAAIVLLVLTRCETETVKSEIQLEQGFVNPPSSAQPRVWWHWMNGNITKDGIQKDLEWMKRSGIGGFQNFDAAFMTPQIVENRLVYMTPEWKEAFQFTTELADSLGLEMAIAGSPGWSESGGPWVPAAEGMKKMVWSEMMVEGGKAFKGILPHPPTSTGAFQNLQAQGESSITGGEEKPIPEYYADAAVIAYKVPDADKTLQELNPKITSSAGTFTLEQLTDGDLVTSSFLPAAKEGKLSWVQFEFDQPQTIQSISMVGGGDVGRFGSISSREKRMLEYSTDGKNFNKIIDITAGGINQRTITFDDVTAKYFRVAISTPPPPKPGEGNMFFGNMGGEQGPQGTKIAEIVLHTIPRIQYFEQKAGFAYVTDVETILTPETETENTIKEEKVINLTEQMADDGTLEWEVPEGKWNVIRVGYSLTGHQNSPASPEATGLEVDKLNPGYVTNYFTNYFDQYKDATGGLMGDRGLQYVITDSYEAGAANWTDRMIEEFNQRNSYDIIPWLPVLTGKIVKSSEASEKFLWDFRNTLEEMIAEYHYDGLSSILEERNMGRYTESHEDKRAMIADGMEVKKNADIPMSATWVPDGRGPVGPNGPTVQTRFKADVRESASVAHIYGQNIAAAESFTAIGNSFAFAPERLKSTADIMLSNGLNRFVIHTSVHQPVDNKFPGLGLGPFGQWFTRHETWAEQAKPWMDYLARSSYMLQQGKFVADIIYIYGQGSNLTWLFKDEMPPVPEGYNYDFLNAGAISSVLSAKDGQVVTQTGMNYNLLVLDASTRYMTLDVLKKIQELVNAGVTVLGPKPINTPSLNDDEEEFQTIVSQLWDEGKVYSGKSMAEVLNTLNIKPDFQYVKQQKNNMKFVHRTLENQDLYWVNTTSKESQKQELTFRISGMEPEVWNPVTGEISPVSYKMDAEKTTISLSMDPEDALFIVFRNKTKEKSKVLPEITESELLSISGDWEVKFQPERGAPESAMFSVLTPWNESENSGIKYFSGTAEYTKTFDVPEEWLSEQAELYLDLGEVDNLAEVILNGKSLGIVWKKPFKVNLNEAIKAGENELSVKVTNLWVNRLIGDQQPGVENPVTYTTQPFYRADSPLLPSGMMGPVIITSCKEKN